MARIVELNPAGSTPSQPTQPVDPTQPTPIPGANGGTDGTWTLYPQTSGVPRITVTYTVPGSNFNVIIQRLGPDGTWSNVRGQTGLTGGSTVTFDDTESGFGYPVHYRSTLASGSVISTSTVAAGLAPVGPWLRHPTMPSLGMAVKIPLNGITDLGRPSSSASFDIIGRPDAVGVADGNRKALRGTLVVRLRTAAERATWESLTNGEAPLLFDVDVRKDNWDLIHAYLKLGDVSYQNEAGWGDWPVRIVTVPFSVVQPSTTASLAAWNLLAIGTSYSTLGAIGAAYKTLGGLAANLPGT